MRKLTASGQRTPPPAVVGHHHLHHQTPSPSIQTQQAAGWSHEARKTDTKSCRRSHPTCAGQSLDHLDESAASKSSREVQQSIVGGCTLRQLDQHGPEGVRGNVSRSKLRDTVWLDTSLRWTLALTFTLACMQTSSPRPILRPAHQSDDPLERDLSDDAVAAVRRHRRRRCGDRNGSRIDEQPASQLHI